MKALVTGANGHIGNHVVRACIAAGIEPIAFVRASSDLRALDPIEDLALLQEVRDAVSKEPS